MNSDIYSEDEPYLTLAEAGKIMRLSPQSVRRKVKSGEIPYHQPDRKILIPKKEAIFWVEKHNKN